MHDLVQNFCCRDDLTTFDPYDIWKTPIGFRVKKLFNENRLLGLAPAALLALTDLIANPVLRRLYTHQEYPVVRAMAALALLNVAEKKTDDEAMFYARKHLDWLQAHSSHGYSGHCWGIGFDYPVAAGLVYDANTPFTTNTPYPLEAFVRYRQLTGNTDFDQLITSIFRFFNRDIPVLQEDEEICITAYGPRKDRVVTNAVSYTLYSLVLLRDFVTDQEREQIASKVNKLFRFIKRVQREDGSWFYSPEGHSFVDCFHSCFILKNVVKAGRLFPLEDQDCVISAGFQYLKENMFDPDTGLFRRFSVANKPGLVKFDLYDNAEALGLSFLLGEVQMADQLEKAIRHRFIVNDDIYSQIDLCGFRRQKNTLRWAVMPYLLALSEGLGCKE